MDPKVHDNKSYELTKKSDIYSLGVVYWELTSCSSPFDFKNKFDRNQITLIILGIIDGEREIPIPNTNSKFISYSL